MTKKKPTSRNQFQEKFGRPIENFDAVKRAVESIREVTRQNYYRVLPSYFLFLNENPDQVIEQRRKDIGSKNYEEAERYERKTTAYANLLLGKDYSGRAVQGFIGRVQGFFANNSRRYSLDMRRLKLPKARKIQKYSPTNEEVRHLYTIADSSRDKLILALMYQNGPSPVDVSLLKVGDLPKTEWAYYERSRSKTGEIWRGVVTPDIAYELRTYLEIRTKLIEQDLRELQQQKKPNEETEKREQREEKEKYLRGLLAVGEPLFMGSRGSLDNQAISGIVSDLIDKSGLNGNSGFKPSSLRDAFEDALVEANVNHKTKECLMGHVSGIEHEYGGQNKLIIVVTEAMKKAYPYLALNGLARESTTQQVSKEEFEAMKRELKKLQKTVDLISKYKWNLTENGASALQDERKSEAEEKKEES